MSLADLRVLARRWYATAFGLALTAALCFAALSAIAPTYEVKADVLFMPPKDVVHAGGNPYLALGDLSAFADVASRTLSSQQSVQQLQSKGATGAYTVALDATAAGPVVLVTVDAPTPTEALATLRIVLDQLPRTVAQVQTANGIAPASQIGSTVITRDDQANASRKSQLRALIVALFAGLVMTFFGTSLLDGYLARRRGRGALPAQAPEQGSAVGGTGVKNVRPAPAPQPAPLPVPQPARLAVEARPDQEGVQARPDQEGTGSRSHDQATVNVTAEASRRRVTWPAPVNPGGAVRHGQLHLEDDPTP